MTGATRACDGCLGAGECWICTGAGCHRCAATGRCHLCLPDQVVQLPAQRAPGAAARAPVTAS